jgi:bifunctional non-homologous end joining protein LigD
MRPGFFMAPFLEPGSAIMGLQEYRRKRDFKKTPEPSGGKAKRTPAKLQFVIQKHAASRLHYDFRLELDGVLKSWAVPKGPSLDPAEKRLAVHVEDHPLEYGGFEGTIPADEYGGGAVMLWDRGEWTPLGDPHRDYRAGRLKFVLKGRRLKGAWALVRMRTDDSADNWLLMKEKDAAARPGDGDGVTVRNMTSVASRRKMESIAKEGGIVLKEGRRAPKSAQRAARARPTASPAKSHRTATKRKKATRAGDADAGDEPARLATGGSAADADLDPRDVAIPPAEIARIAGAVKAAMPEFFPPQLATLVTAAPEGDEWLHEVKFDGYRILAFVSAGGVSLLTRKGNDWTRKFGGVAAALKGLRVRGGAVLDGEVVVMRPDGTTDFQALQQALRGEQRTPLCFCAFDLPYANGYDLREVSLEKRKQALRGLIEEAGLPRDRLLLSEHVRGAGPELLKQMCGLRLEGMISKRADSPYESTRSRSWLKVKCGRAQEFVIGGYTDPQGAREGFGALLVGYYAGDALRYAGKVGTGFDTAELNRLIRRFRAIEQDEMPFEGEVPRAEVRRAHWVRPEMVAEVTFTEWTGDGRLRHPVYHGLREDKPAKEVRREMPQATTKAATGKQSSPKSAKKPAKKADPRVNAKPASKAPQAGGAAFELTSPDKVLYPEQGLTKRDLAEYYVAVEKWILPHVVDRPLSLVRCPEGRAKKCFFQRHHSETMPDSIYPVSIEEQDKQRADYLYIRDRKGLIGLVQMGVLELHVWGSRVDRPDRPDRMIFDLDPDESLPFSEVMDAARLLRERLDDLSLASFVKTTGGKGLHVVIPLERRASWDDVRNFSEAMVRQLASEQPKRFVANMRKALRGGKIFLDYLRNGKGATSVAPYSTRAKPNATVSTPVAWEELTPALKPDAFNIQNVPARLARLKRDPWTGMDRVRQRLPEL